MVSAAMRGGSGRRETREARSAGGCPSVAPPRQNTTLFALRGPKSMLPRTGTGLGSTQVQQRGLTGRRETVTTRPRV
jgi:hypothetical protein